MPATLQALVRVRSRLARDLTDYLAAVVACPDSPEELPAYVGERLPATLYVQPDVFKRERRARRSPLDPRHDGSRARGGGPDETHTPAQRQFSPETEDIGEQWPDPRHGEATDRRVPWSEERIELEHGDPRCAVMLGPPGQGKTVMARMTARSLAADSLAALRAGTHGTDTISIPISMPLNALPAQSLHPGQEPEEAFRELVSARLRETGSPPAAAAWLASHAHENRCVLFLDGLDEAPDDAILDRLFLGLSRVQCRVLITSRPYGYEARRLPFDVTEYRLAPFSQDQAREFVDKWFELRPQADRMNALIDQSASVREMSENPFLLTLLCWVLERRDLAHDLTRSQLYDLVLRDLLGLVPPGRTILESRAADWLPLLSDIAFTWFRESAGRAPMPYERLLNLIEQHPRRPPLLGLDARQLATLTPRQQAGFLIDELRQKRVLTPRSPTREDYLAPHRSILEYLAARALARVVNDPERNGWEGSVDGSQHGRIVRRFVDKKAWDPDWEQVMAFLVGQLEDSSPLLEMLSDPTPTPTNPTGDDFVRHRLALAALCLPELASDQRAQFADLLDRITTEVCSFWLEHQEEPDRWPVAHLERVLPGIARVNGRMRGVPLLAFVSEQLAKDGPDRMAVLLFVRHLGSAAAIPPILDPLLALLQHRRSEVGWAAADALGGLGAAAAIPHVLDELVTLLSHNDTDTRRVAAVALGGLGGAAATPKVLDAFIEILSDRRRRWDSHLAFCAGRLGRRAATPKMLDRLVALRHDHDDEMRGRAGEFLAQLAGVADSSEVVDALVPFLQDPDEGVRWRTADVFKGLGSAAATAQMQDALVLLLRDHDPNTCVMALEVVARLGRAAATPKLTDALLPLLQDPRDAIRMWAGQSVGYAGNIALTAQEVDPVVAGLRDPDHYAEAAVELLGLCYGLATPPVQMLDAIVALLSDCDDTLRFAVVNSMLGVVQMRGSTARVPAAPQVLRAIVALLCDPNVSVRAATAETLCLMEGLAITTRLSPRLVDALVPLLSDPNEGARARAASAAGHLGSAAASPRILDLVWPLLRDPAREVRVAAIATLERFMSEGVRIFPGEGPSPMVRGLTIQGLSREG
ncbi:MAG: HEAT repeat domain-containing protein [Kiritimatiellae bacterium]|nr:HEAT repeat domain-containing protein [Kiritimatiellia bacterium]